MVPMRVKVITVAFLAAACGAESQPSQPPQPPTTTHRVTFGPVDVRDAHRASMATHHTNATGDVTLGFATSERTLRYPIPSCIIMPDDTETFQVATNAGAVSVVFDDAPGFDRFNSENCFPWDR